MFADTNQWYIDNNIHIRHSGEQDTFHWKYLVESGFIGNRFDNYHNITNMANSGIVNGYYRPTTINTGANTPWTTKLIKESGYYGNVILDRPSPLYVERLMKRLDEIAVAHGWTEFDSDNELIGPSGFRWYKYYGTIRQEFTPNSRSPYQLNGYPITNIDFWRRLDRALVFAYDRAGSLPEYIDSDYEFFFTSSGIAVFPEGIQGSGKVIEGYPSYADSSYNNNTFSNITSSLGKSKYRLAELSTTVSGVYIPYSGIDQNGGFRYYYGPDKYRIPSLLFGVAESGMALFLRNQIVTDNGDQVYPIYSENSSRSTATSQLRKHLFYGVSGINPIGLKYLRGLTQPQYYSLVDTWYGLNVQKKYNDPLVSDEAILSLFGFLQPSWRTISKSASISTYSYVAQGTPGNYTLGDILGPPDTSFLQSFYNELGWGCHSGVSFSKDALKNPGFLNPIGTVGTLIASGSDAFKTATFANSYNHRSNASSFQNYFYTVAKQVLPHTYVETTIDHTTSGDFTSTRDRTMFIPKGDSVGDRGFASMSTTFSYCVYPVSLKAYHQPNVQGLLNSDKDVSIFTDPSFDVNNISIIVSGQTSLNNHFKNNPSRPLRSRLGYRNEDLGKLYYRPLSIIGNNTYTSQGYNTPYSLSRNEVNDTVIDASINPYQIPDAYSGADYDDFVIFGVSEIHDSGYIPYGNYWHAALTNIILEEFENNLLFFSSGDYGVINYPPYLAMATDLSIGPSNPFGIGANANTVYIDMNDYIDIWNIYQSALSSSVDADTEFIYGFIDIFEDGLEYPVGTKVINGGDFYGNEHGSISTINNPPSNMSHIFIESNKLDAAIANKIKNGNYTVITTISVTQSGYQEPTYEYPTGTGLFGIPNNSSRASHYENLFTVSSGILADIQTIRDIFNEIPTSGSTHIWFGIKPKVFDPDYMVTPVAATAPSYIGFTRNFHRFYESGVLVDSYTEPEVISLPISVEPPSLGQYISGGTRFDISFNNGVSGGLGHPWSGIQAIDSGNLVVFPRIGLHTINLNLPSGYDNNLGYIHNHDFQYTFPVEY